ncbi:MAG: FAD:protein FMN transferase [Gammaproteobacteria bacterium]|nr:FAD:protein FMN transferase [Gammaproteobacteria bacterium]MCP5135542.1 FAD:protein FMN transferase [Gammaproteobacteria bacterium]
MLAFARLLFLIGVLNLFGGCAPPPIQQRTLYVFGTLVDVRVASADRNAFDAAMREIEQRFQGMHHALHAWQPGMLVDLNTAIASGKTRCVSAEIVQLIERSAQAERASGERFNAAIGGLIGLWGFHTDEPLTGDPPPAAEVIRKLVAARPRVTDLSIDGAGCVRSSNPTVSLDFGGIAKGSAVDAAIGILRKHGLDNAIVNAGGDLRAVGSRDGLPWRIGVRHPKQGGALAEIEVIGDESVFTSGNYERFNEYDGVRYAHILDPQTGYPVVGIASATVIHKDADWADAAATALVVAGVAHWQEVVTGMQLDQVLLVDEQGHLHMTPAMQARVKRVSAASLNH